MTTNVKPRLCGGIFYALLLEARPQRTNYSEHLRGDTDGLSETNMMVNLCRVVNPEYKTPSKQDSFETTVSKYKSCIISRSAYVVITETKEKRAFNAQVRNNYPDALKAMCDFVDYFIDNGVVTAGYKTLVANLTELILLDDSIDDEQEFYICADGSSVKKKNFSKLSQISLQPFLLGVLNYISETQTDNRVGAETYNTWWSSVNGERYFAGDFGSGYKLAAEILLLNKEDIPAAEPEAVEAEIIEDVPTSDGFSSKADQVPTIQKDGKTIQIIMNQYGSGNKQIAYAENVYESDAAAPKGSKVRCKIIRQTTGESFMLADGIFRIGQDERKCDLVLRDEFVSQIHAEIYQQDGAWIICDVNSMNGVYIAETKLLPGRKYELEDGDDIQIGTEHFRAEVK